MLVTIRVTTKLPTFLLWLRGTKEESHNKKKEKKKCGYFWGSG